MDTDHTCLFTFSCKLTAFRLFEKKILIYSTIRMTLENIMLRKIKTHGTIPLI